MAKDNLFLGFGRGSVGDVTFYRANGQQISRARNRHPRNPKSDAQIVQRAVMAVVQRFYSLGYSLFNHSFQGYSVGAENQRRFVKVNADKIRSAVLASLGGSQTPVYLGAPGVLSPVPNEYIVSEGSYDQQLLSLDAATPSNPLWKLPAATAADTTIAAYAANHGLVPGDIYTILGVFTKSDTMDYEYFDGDGQLVEEASVRKAYFAYLQLRVWSGILSDTTAMDESIHWDDLFDEAHGTTGSKTISEGLSMTDVSGIDGSGAWGVIRSRENEDLRSTTVLSLFGDQSGVTPEWLFRVWTSQSASLASDLVLEGSDFSNAGGSASPTLPDFESAAFVALQGEFGEQSQTPVENPILRLEKSSVSTEISVALSCKYDADGDAYAPWSYTSEGQIELSGIDISEEDSDALAAEIFAVFAAKYSSYSLAFDNVSLFASISAGEFLGLV